MFQRFGVFLTCCFILAGICLALCGCGQRSTTTKPVASTAGPTQPAATSITPKTDDIPPPEDDKTEEPGESTESGNATDAASGAITPAVPESHERLLLLTPAGPLVIEITLAIDGKPFDAALSRLAAEALAAADTDGDGRATWKEVLASPKFKYGQFGNNPITPDMTLKSVTEMYDANRDGLMNAAETPKFLTKNMAGPHAFSLRATNQYRGDNVIESPLRRWLDEDEDGKLSSAEIAAAPVRLRSRDADDDDLLVPSDFVAPAANLMPGEMPQRQKRRYGPEAAHLLGPKAKWNSVLVALEDLYGVDGSSGASAFALTPGLYKQLDADESGSLDKKEVVALNSIEPHIHLSVDFGRDAQKKLPLAQLKLASLAPELSAAVKVVAQDESRLALALPGATLEFYCRDAAPAGDYEEQAQALVTQLDGDKNGYLEKKELPEDSPGFTAPFDTLDVDGDGKIYVADFAAQLARQQTALLSQIQARAGDQEDALFAALDVDADGRLTAREIGGSSARLTVLDADADGQLTVDEVPGSLAVGLVRGDAQADNSPLVAPPPAGRPRAENVPPWFARMDTNEDGELSPLEFLGSLEKFRALDTNGDGFLSLAELQPK